MEAEALYLRDGSSSYVGTILTQGGWDPNGANGGTVLALLGQCLEQVPTLVPMAVSRLTADLVRPVPLGRRLDVAATVLREGKKIQVVQLLLTDADDDLELVRLTALRLRDADLRDRPVPASTTDARPAAALPPPEACTPVLGVAPQQPGFLRAVDLRRAQDADGSVRGSWVRLAVPVVAGEETLPTAHLACAIDYANLVGLDGPTLEMTMINPDVTAHVLRPPRSEWVAVTGDTRFEPALGRGVSIAHLSDADGVFAVSSTSQLVQPR
jgi:hypothetical protein